MAEKNVLEKIWDNPSYPAIYRNETWGIGAWASRYPKLPFESVVMTQRPFRGTRFDLLEIPPRERHMLHALADVVASMSVRIMTEIEQSKLSSDDDWEKHEQQGPIHGHQLVSGFGVPEQPHIIVAPARRSEMAALWQPIEPERQTALYEQARDSLVFDFGDRGVVDALCERIDRMRL